MTETLADAYQAALAMMQVTGPDVNIQLPDRWPVLLGARGV